MVFSSQPVNWLIFIAAAYLTYAISRSEWVWRWGGRVYINMLKAVGERTGLQYSAGSLSPRSVEKPLLSGKYRGRQVSLVIDTKGKWGYTGSLMKISLSLDNKPSDDLPQGAFFVVGDPRKSGWMQQAIRVIGQEAEDDPDVSEFPMKCVPQNLGNHLLSLECVKSLLSKPQTNDMLIAKEFLYYRQVGLETDANVVVQMLGNLCNMADKFERFNRNWIISS